jgi:hypothetical protein
MGRHGDPPRRSARPPLAAQNLGVVRAGWLQVDVVQANEHGRDPAEVTRYAARLGSITPGQGSYTREFSHYDQVPGNVQQQTVSKAKLAAEQED